MTPEDMFRDVQPTVSQSAAAVSKSTSGTSLAAGPSDMKAPERHNEGSRMQDSPHPGPIGEDLAVEVANPLRALPLALLHPPEELVDRDDGQKGEDSCAV
jgi:hypothetical protein